MGSLLCCAAFEACSCACCLGKCLCRGISTSKKCSNYIYLVIFVMTTLLSLVIQQWAAPDFDIYSFDNSCVNVTDIDTCKGDSAVYRVSSGLALWFTILALSNICSTRFHSDFWGLKSILLIVLVGGLFFVPDFGNEGYVNTARILSSLFLVSQLVSFVDAAYNWDESIEEKNTLWDVLIVAAVLGLWTIIVLLYVHYSGCTIGTVFITVSILLIIGTVALQLNIGPFFDKDDERPGSALSTTIVAMYSVYLCWSAVTANPDTCNPAQLETTPVLWGMFLTACSIGWNSYSIGKSYPEDDEDEEGVDYSLIYFHAVMAVGSLYMAMLLTNWGTVSGNQSAVKMWVSISSQWVSILIYIWTLIAPACCKNRGFNEL